MATDKKNTSFAAGWLFWVIVCVVLLAPCTYLSWNWMLDRTPVSAKLTMGLVFAAILSAVISWATNTVVQAREGRKRLMERKARRKKQA